MNYKLSSRNHPAVRLVIPDAQVHLTEFKFHFLSLSLIQVHFLESSKQFWRLTSRVRESYVSLRNFGSVAIANVANGDRGSDTVNVFLSFDFDFETFVLKLGI